MNRGIYIIANDRVLSHAIALVKSIRVYDLETPIMMIPYDEHYKQAAQVLSESYGVQVYQDLDFIDQLSNRLKQYFGDEFFARPNQFRKQACWFGPFDEFLYIDTDIVVFEKIIDNLDYLKEYDFICCDYQHQGGIKNVFSPDVLEAGVFSEEQLTEIFNCGFWGAKKGLVSEQDLYSTFAECAAHPEYFDFSEKTSDQPIINYMILKRVQRRFNIVRQAGGGPGNWAGSERFIRQGHTLWDPDVDKPLQYLHWAGFRIQPGCPYWDIWSHYRFLDEPLPEWAIYKPTRKKTWQKMVEKVKDKARSLKSKVLNPS